MKKNKELIISKELKKIAEELATKHAISKNYIGFSGTDGFMCQIHYPELCKIIAEDRQHMLAQMFLFARWMATLYADTHSHACDGMSVLNIENGEWWKDKLEYFNKVVYPNYVENNTVKETNKFLNNTKKK